MPSSFAFSLLIKTTALALNVLTVQILVHILWFEEFYTSEYGTYILCKSNTKPVVNIQDVI